MDLVNVYPYTKQREHLKLSDRLRDAELSVTLIEDSCGLWRATICTEYFSTAGEPNRDIKFALLNLIKEFDKNKDLYKLTPFHLEENQMFFIPDPELFKYVGGDIVSSVPYGSTK